jgi:hypothetical protein
VGDMAAPYRSMPRLLHGEGDNHYDELAGAADIKYEQARLPEMIAACESARIGDPPSGARRRLDPRPTGEASATLAASSRP